MLAERERFGRIDWYARDARCLLDMLPAERRDDSAFAVGTAFDLLFLRRATTPLAVITGGGADREADK